MLSSQVDRNKTHVYKGKQDLPAERMIEDARSQDLDRPRLVKARAENYLPDPGILDAVNLAITLGRPLLLQGDPGCGKTRLAYAVAYELGLPLEECYIKSTSKAQDFLYVYDAITRLYDAQVKNKRSNQASNYIKLGPLGRAMARAMHGRRSVVLIDEIDKADLDFPNDLLLELDRLMFQVAEDETMRYAVPEGRPDLRPIVIITHNEEKALPAAFLRRCIYYYVKMPETIEHLQNILHIKGFTNTGLTDQAARVLLSLRKLELNKKPGLSELLDWVGYLDLIQLPLEKFEQLPYMGALLKDQADQKRARSEFHLAEDGSSQGANAPETAEEGKETARQ